MLKIADSILLTQEILRISFQSLKVNNILKYNIFEIYLKHSEQQNNSGVDENSQMLNSIHNTK